MSTYETKSSNRSEDNPVDAALSSSKRVIESNNSDQLFPNFNYRAGGLTLSGFALTAAAFGLFGFTGYPTAESDKSDKEPTPLVENSLTVKTPQGSKEIVLRGPPAALDPTNGLSLPLSSVVSRVSGWMNVTRPLQTGDLQGRVTVVYFWSRTCAPCLAKIPFLNKISASPGITVIAVTGDDKSDAKWIVNSANPNLKLAVPIVYGAKALKHEAGVSAIPAVIIYDGNGVAQWAKAGISEADISDAIMLVSANAANNSKISKSNNSVTDRTERFPLSQPGNIIELAQKDEKTSEQDLRPVQFVNYSASKLEQFKEDNYPRIKKDGYFSSNDIQVISDFFINNLPTEGWNGHIEVRRLAINEWSALIQFARKLPRGTREPLERKLASLALSWLGQVQTGNREQSRNREPTGQLRAELSYQLYDIVYADPFPSRQELADKLSKLLSAEHDPLALTALERSIYHLENGPYETRTSLINSLLGSSADTPEATAGKDWMFWLESSQISPKLIKDLITYGFEIPIGGNGSEINALGFISRIYLLEAVDLATRSGTSPLAAAISETLSNELAANFVKDSGRDWLLDVRWLHRITGLGVSSLTIENAQHLLTRIEEIKRSDAGANTELRWACTAVEKMLRQRFSTLAPGSTDNQISSSTFK